MKKFLLIIVTLLVIPFIVNAASFKVLTLETEASEKTINYSGTTENGATAVMCKLYDSTNKEVDKLSSSVDDSKFSGSFTVSDNGDYVVACANYEGGEIKKATISVTSNTEENGNEETEETFVVSFNSNGGTTIKDKTVKKGSLVSEPENPEKGEMIFEGWYTDKELTTKYYFNKEVTGNFTLYAKWIEEETKTNNYSATDDNGNKIEFKEEEGHTYKLNVIDYLLFTEEDLTKAEIPKDLYDEALNGIKNATKKHGALLAVYDIVVTDENEDTIHDGPFTIRIKLTDDLKKYNSFKLIFVDDDLSIETPIELKIDGEYLVGTLPHLSNYVLVGSNVTSPKTLDNVLTYVIIGFIGLVGVSSILVIKKKKAN